MLNLAYKRGANSRIHGIPIKLIKSRKSYSFSLVPEVL